MTNLAIVTPSLAADYQLFCDLHRSVLEYTPAEVVHHVIVPVCDLERFAWARGPRCTIWSEDELLPRRMIATPWINRAFSLVPTRNRSRRIAAINIRRPFPPIRGWVLQQMLKMAAATHLGADVVLFVDSDVVFIRPVTEATFQRAGHVRFYRRDDEIDGRLPHHLKWHAVARKLLGLPPASSPLPDYVSSLNAWDPKVVAALQERIQTVAGRHWLDVLGGQIHLSEWILYGVFVDQILGTPTNEFAASDTLCHSYWDTTPLDTEAAAAFVHRLPAGDVAVLIQSKSGTPVEVRHAALAMIPR